MINLEQEVKIKWLTRNKKRYEQLGYNYTGVNTEFEVKLADLDKNSSKKVKVQCDKCGIEIITPYRNYNKIVDNKGSYLCRKCNASLTSNIRRNNNKERQLKDFEDMVMKKGYTPTATLDDYKGCDTPMPFICSKHGMQYLSINQLRQGCSCPKCRTSPRKLPVDKVIEKINEKNCDVLLNPGEYIDSKTSNLRIKCGSCGDEFVTSFARIRNSNGYCPNCAIKRTVMTSILKKEDLINNTTHNGICYLLNPDDYKNATTRNLIFRCRVCSEVFLYGLYSLPPRTGLL